MGTNPAKRRAALHEAGHVVIARAAGYTVHKVEIHEDGSGRCWTPPIARNSPEALKTELSYLLAGRLAVLLDADEPLWRLSLPDIIDKEVIPGSYGSSAQGLQGFRRSVAELYGSESAAERWLEVQLPLIAKETYRVLLVRWAEVVDIASRLIKHGTVDLAENGPAALSGRTSWDHREFALARTNPPRRTPTIRLLPVEIAASLRLLSNDNSTASSKAKVSSVLAEAGYEVVST